MNYEFLSRTFLFQGTSPEETKHMLSLSESHSAKLCQGQHDLAGGRPGEDEGLVLNGSVHIESIDMMGNQEYSEPDCARPGFRRDICLHSRGKAAHRGDSCRGLPDPFSGGGKDFSHLSRIPVPAMRN